VLAVKLSSELLMQHGGEPVLMANYATDAVVAADGSGHYNTITAAIAAVPPNNDKRYVIHIKRGVYKEFIVLGLEKWNVVLIGDGMEATVISGNRCCADGFDTRGTAVLCEHPFLVM